MNIFLLDVNAAVCATYYCDTHLRKCTEELIEMLAIAHILGTSAVASLRPQLAAAVLQRRRSVESLPAAVRNTVPGPVSAAIPWVRIWLWTYPPAVWVRTCAANYRWAAWLARALVQEHAYRFGTQHRHAGLVAWLAQHEPPVYGTYLDSTLGPSILHSLIKPSSPPDVPAAAQQEPATRAGDGDTYMASEGVPPGCSPFPLAMYPAFWRSNAVEAYRAYYNGAKVNIAAYTRQARPAWLRPYHHGRREDVLSLFPKPVKRRLDVCEAIDAVLEEQTRQVGGEGIGKSGHGSGHQLPDRRFRVLASPHTIPWPPVPGPVQRDIRSYFSTGPHISGARYGLAKNVSEAGDGSGPGAGAGHSDPARDEVVPHGATGARAEGGAQPSNSHRRVWLVLSVSTGLE